MQHATNLEIESTHKGQKHEVTKKNTKKEIVSWVKFIILLALAVFIIKGSIGFTIVVGDSMQPSLRDGSFLLVNKVPANFSEPIYGDVVVIEEAGYDIIKRVIGVHGDTVAIQEGVVYVNQLPLPELHTIGEANDMSPITIQTGKIFVMGDNRTPGESLDSRDSDFGQVSVENVKGYATISLFPFYKISKPLKL